MSAKHFLNLVLKKRNRVVSIIVRDYKALILSLEITVLYWLAVLQNLLDKSYFNRITEEQVAIQNPDGGLVINCMGDVDLSNTKGYQQDLASIRGLLGKADLSLAHVTGASDDNKKAAVQLLDGYGIKLLSSEYMIQPQILHTEFGGIGIVTYERFREAARTSHVKVELMRCLLVLKARKADYIIVYVGNRMRSGGITSKEAKLYRLMSRMGADYIVGVTPNCRDSGSTYLKRDGRVARSVYSLGTFLSNNKKISHRRVVLRLKLRRINGQLCLFHETYFPYYRISRYGLVSLIQGNERYLSKEKARDCLAETENEMRRIRPANRAFTIGKMMELIHTPLPEEYQYLAEFSVGKVCSRSFEVMPGDVFFFREPFEDPNDLEPVNPRMRLRIPKRVAKQGAMLLISFQKLPFACRCVVTDNAMEAHIKVCAYLRNQFQMHTIGITGSIGKTSTKDMLAEVMKMRYHTVKSERNSNVQVKIGMNLQKLDSSCDVFIQEIGGGRPGGASRHARMIRPEVTVVTNIGDAHIGNFGSREKLMENKLQIIEGMTDQGVLYLNGDDPLLVTARPKCKTVFYAVRNKKADYYVENLTERGASTFFTIVHGQHKARVRLNVLGEYNVLNAVCCFAIGEQFKIPEKDILQGLTHFHTTGIRQNLVRVCGRKFFMDCYNASSESVKSSMEVLTKIAIEPGKKRIAVLGDITGMGDLTEKIHQDIGQTLMRYPVDQVVLYGDSVKYTQEVLEEHGIDSLRFTNRKELNHTLEQLVDEGDVVLFKGSSKMLLEQSVDMVYGTRLTDQRLLDESEYRRVRKKGVTYDLFGTYATVSAYTPDRSGKGIVRVSDMVGSIPVVNIGPAFTGRNVVEVQIPASIRHIASNAFKGCNRLKKLQLPRSLKFIGNYAFQDCCGLCQMDLPKGLLHIGAGAFQGCTGLTEITIPDSVVQIGKNAFKTGGKLTIRCSQGSYAQQYLKEANIPYVIDENSDRNVAAKA